MTRELPPGTRTFHLSARNRVTAFLLAIAVIALGGVFVVFGLVLLLVLAGAGTLLGAGVMLYHRITGRWPRFLGGGSARARRPAEGTALDPAQEVFPDEVPRQEEHNDRLRPG